MMKRMKMVTMTTVGLVILSLALVGGCSGVSSLGTGGTYTVTFDLNRAVGIAPVPMKVSKGEVIILPTLTPEKNNITREDFLGWYDGRVKHTYKAGTEYTPTANITLYAEFEGMTLTYTINLDPQGGTGGDTSVQVPEPIETNDPDLLEPMPALNKLPTLTIDKYDYIFGGYWKTPVGTATPDGSGNIIAEFMDCDTNGDGIVGVTELKELKAVQYYTVTGTSAHGWDGGGDDVDRTELTEGRFTLYAAWNKIMDGTLNIGTLEGEGENEAWTYEHTTKLGEVDPTVYIEHGGNVTLTGGTGTISVVIRKGASATVTLKDVDLNFLRADKPELTQWGRTPFRLDEDSNCKLILSGTNKIETAGTCAAVNVPEGTTLTITSIKGDGSEVGRLDARQGTDNGKNKRVYSSNGYGYDDMRYGHGRGGEGAAIGGNQFQNAGHIIINGGWINAESWGMAAGIGGGASGHGGTIEIHGGAVNAFCRVVGGALNMPDSVRACRGFGGAGIGAGGVSGYDSNKKFKEEPHYDLTAVFVVRSTGELSGGGSEAYVSKGRHTDPAEANRGTTIIIDGGRVRGIGGQDAAGIGGGVLWVYPQLLKISGNARVTAWSGFSHWGGHMYAVGPGRQDIVGTEDPPIDSFQVFSGSNTSLSDLRMDNGEWRDWENYYRRLKLKLNGGAGKFDNLTETDAPGLTPWLYDYTGYPAYTDDFEINPGHEP